MTQEDKELLLKDLCARVPYGVYLSCKWKKEAPNGTTGAIFTLDSKYLDDIYNIDCSDVPFDEFMPYLRPLSSMTKEEKEELELLCDSMEIDDEGNVFDFIIILLNHIPKNINLEVIDWLNSHHFDYRGLIGKGLALEAPEDMYDFLWKD